MTREYQPLIAQELVACTCDRCQRRLTSDEPGEWQERLSFDHSCGFDSVFGDRNTVSLDLCQHCVREVLGQWLHIETPEETGESTSLARALMTMPNVGNDADFAREPREERRNSTLSPTALKGSIPKPAKSVSVADMNAAIAEGAGKAARRFGGLKGRVRMQQDFDTPLSLSPVSKKKLKKRP
ncbi:MAG: hypothetical protein ACLFVM_12930 [Ralstonia sp.]